MREDRYSTADLNLDQEQADIAQRRAMLQRLLRGRWHWAIMLAVLLSVVGGYLGFNSQGQRYEAASTIEIKPKIITAATITDLSQYEPYQQFLDGEVRRLRSLEVAELAMEQPEWQEHLSLRPANLQEITPAKFAKLFYVDEPDKNETVMTIGFIDEDPNTARAGLNSLFQAYEKLTKEVRSDQIGDNIRLLQNQKRSLQDEIAALKSQIQLVIPDEEMHTIDARRAARLGELANMEFQLSEIELELGPYLKAQGAPEEEGPSLSLRDLMLQDPEMVALLEQKKQLEDQYIYLTEVLNRGETMQDVVQVRRGITMTDRKIAELEAAWLARGQQPDKVQQVPAAVAELLNRRDALIEKIAQLTAQTTDMSRRIAAVEEYKVQIEEIRDTLLETNRQISEFERTGITVNENEDVTRIVIGPPATTPTTAYNTGKRRQLAGVGAIGGMFMGFGLVMSVGYFDRRLRHVADTTIGMPEANVLGILPTLPADLKDPEDAETAAHCVHHIRTLMQIGGSNRVFSITSPSAGSGKSSLATALGMSFAASGARTLVIDCDLVGAGLSRRMGTVVHEPLDAVIRRNRLMDEADLAHAQTAAATHGTQLADVLVSQGLLNQDKIDTATRLQRDTSLGLLDACAPSKLRSCVAATGIDNLYILPVGKAKPSDASRLSPAAMRELVRQAREAFDIVLIDTGPILGSLEASIASAESDATVLIVSRGDQRNLVARTIEQLRSVRANIAGLVFNHALERDLAHTSYASVVSQERRPERPARKRRLDKTRTARLGPLGTAVASYIDEEADTNGEAFPVNGEAIVQEPDED